MDLSRNLWVFFVINLLHQPSIQLFLHVNVSVFVHNSRTKDDENIQGTHGTIHRKSKISVKVPASQSSVNNFHQLATLKQEIKIPITDWN